MLAAQLYTLRDFTKTPADIAKTLARVRKLGYLGVQVSALGPIDPKELAKILNNEGLACVATHVGIDARVPLDMQGTEFQQRVWRALREIPAGTRRSYAEVAKAIGQPSASRAVARACATNRLAVIVPCHRVVRGDGDMAGYKWGTERKKRLLDKESQ